MGKLNKWLISGVVLFTLSGLIACSDDDTAQKKLTPIFSEPLSLQCDVDEERTFEFTADVDWKLTSDAIWCKLSTDGDLFAYDVAGGAGLQNIIVQVGADGQPFETTTAKLTLIREGQSEILATVSRSPKGYNLKVLSVEGAELNSLDITSSGSITFEVDANFMFGAVEQPEWLSDMQVSYSDNSTRATFTATVSEEYTPRTMMGSIVFANEDRSVEYPYSIAYAGMNPEKVEIIGETPWEWNLSSDATTFIGGNSLSGTAPSYSGSIPFKVNTLNYNCHYICFEVVDEKLQLMNNGWIKIDVDADEPSKVNISGEAYPAETEGERKAYVYAVPDAVYEKIMDIHAESADMTAFLDSTENYVMLELTQVSDYVDSTPRFIVKGYDTSEIACFEETDANILALINEKYPVKKGVYAVSAEVASGLIVEPLLTDKEWVGWEPDNTVIMDTDGNIMEFSEVGFEISLDSNDEYYYVMLKAIAKPYIILFKGVDGEYIKALVVKSGITLDPGTGFTVKYQKMTADLACSLETDMELAASIIERYGVYEIYSVTENAGETIFIFSHLSEDVWIPGSLDGFILADADGNIVDYQDVGLECGQNPSNTSEYYAAFVIPDYTIIMVFVDADGNNRKAIVVKPKNV